MCFTRAVATSLSVHNDGTIFGIMNNTSARCLGAVGSGFSCGHAFMEKSVLIDSKAPGNVNIIRGQIHRQQEDRMPITTHVTTTQIHSHTLVPRTSNLSASQRRPRSTTAAIPELALGDLNLGIVHPNTQLPPSHPGPKVLKQPQQLPFFIPLAQVKPAHVRARRRLRDHASAPLVCANHDVLVCGPRVASASTLRDGRLDKRRVHAGVLGPVSGNGKGGHVGDCFEGYLEEGLWAWWCYSFCCCRGVVVVGKYLDLFCAVGEIFPFEAG